MNSATLPAQRNPALGRALLIAVAYGVWTAMFRLICLTFITYLVIATDKLGGGAGTASQGARLEEINEAYGSIELIVLGMGSLVFAACLKLLRADAIPGLGELLSRRKLERAVLPGLIQGGALAGGLLALFLAAGNHRYLGSFVQLEDNPLLALAGLLIQALSLVVLACCEEIVFRHEILGGLREAGLPLGRALGLSALLYTAVKFLQLDLGWMQGLSLGLLSLDLGLRLENGNDFVAGAAFWGAILVVFHPVAGLPVLGNDGAAGLALVKFQAGGHGQAARAMRLLAGGTGGPLASVSFQLLLAFDILRGSHFNFRIFRMFKKRLVSNRDREQEIPPPNPCKRSEHGPGAPGGAGD